MFAARMSRVEGSSTVKLGDEVAKLRAKGIDVISFTMGEPDFPTPAHIREAAKKALDAGETHYTPSLGIMPLREAVAETSQRDNGIPCKASDVMISPAKLAILSAVMAAVDKGDEVIIPDPAWVSYEPMTNLAGGKAVLAPCDSEKGFRLLPETVGELITKKTRMIIINTPSNPTGGVMERSDLEGIAQLAADHGIWVLSDEIYQKLVYEGSHLSIASLPGMFERTVTVSGFSKSYAMTGWRLGYAVAPKPLMEQMTKFHQHSITCCTSFAQHGAVAALRGPQDELKNMKTEFSARRDLVVKKLCGISGVSCPTPKGAFYAFPKYSADIPSSELAAKLTTEGHVAVTPGSAFGPHGEGYIRLSYALSRDKIVEGCERIKKVMESL